MDIVNISLGVLLFGLLCDFTVRLFVKLYIDMRDRLKEK